MVDDDIQKVIFNPARAGEMDGGFISTNIIPSGNQDNFSLIGLTKSKWFFSFGGNLVTNNSDGEEYRRFADNTRISFENGERYSSRSNFYRSEFENERTNFAGDVSISKIFSTGSGRSYSIGVFTGYSISKDNRLNMGTESRTVSSYFEQDTLSESRISQQFREFNSDSKTNNEKFVFGIEFSTFKNGTDSKHKLFIQQNDLNSNSQSLNSVRDFNSYSDNQGYTRSIVLDVRNDSSFMNSEPLQFRYEGFINKTVSWIGNNDYIFLSANAVYSKGEQDFFDLYLSSRTYSVDDSVVQVQNGSGGINNQPSYYPPTNNIDDELKGGAVSLGYILSIEDEDLNFFTGINPYFNTYKISNARQDNDLLFDVDQKVYEIGTQIPLFISYDIKEFFSVWGGGNLNATYTNSNVNEMQRFRCHPLTVCAPPLPSKRSLNSFRYSESLFMGFKLSHKSGLSLVNNFRSNLSNVNSWVTSLRYSF
ncbi:MAG: hypothetical protein CL667_05450 [Balneola sp.]|nr:hypothetical protein [Balneola sp.]